MALLWWPKLSYRAERVRHHGQRLVQIRLQLLVGHVVRDLAHAVHVVGKADQAGRDLVLRSALRRRGAPWSCAPLRRRCRYAAGPTGRSPSRTAGFCGSRFSIRQFSRFFERPRFGLGGRLDKLLRKVKRRQGLVGHVLKVVSIVLEGIAAKPGQYPGLVSLMRRDTRKQRGRRQSIVKGNMLEAEGLSSYIGATEMPIGGQGELKSVRTRPDQH
jgi:hypothetical protein